MAAFGGKWSSGVVTKLCYDEMCDDYYGDSEEEYYHRPKYQVQLDSKKVINVHFDTDVYIKALETSALESTHNEHRWHLVISFCATDIPRC